MDAQSEFEYSYDYYTYEETIEITDLAEVTLIGGAGNDHLESNVYGGVAVLEGGDGDDFLDAFASEGLTMTGGAGRDTIAIYWDGDPNDTNAVVTDFVVGAGGDLLEMSGLLGSMVTHTSYPGENPFGSGHLELVQSGPDTLMVVHTDPGAGSDNQIVVLTLRDVLVQDLEVENFSQAINPDGSPIPGEFVRGTSGQDFLYGTVGGDLIKGFGDTDYIYAEIGSDIIYAGGGADQVFGGAGNDAITGAGGGDELYGGSGDDAIHGGAGHDDIYAGGGNDTIDGGSGRESIIAHDYDYADVVSVVIEGGDGDDSISVQDESEYGYSYDPYGNYDRYVVTAAEASVSGGQGDDTINVRVYGGIATVDGGAGDDDILVNAVSGATITGGSGQDRITVEGLTEFDDNVVQITDFETGVGGDIVNLNRVVELLVNTTTFIDGNPFTTGHFELDQDGADVSLVLSTDPDAGSPVNDTYIMMTFLNTNVGDFVVDNFAPMINPLGGAVPGEIILGFGGDDMLQGGFGDDEIKGFGGSDDINGFSGSDLIYAGADTDFVNGGAGNDIIYGGGARDYLSGGGGDDTITGNGGGDFLFGGSGVDHLTGNGGNDRFVFVAGDSGIGEGQRDVIADFSNGDRINLDGIGSFVFAGTTATDNGLWYEVAGEDSIVKLDLDGDAVADFEIELTGVTSLTDTDFV